MENRQKKMSPVFLIKSKKVDEERAALLTAGGVVTKANGHPTVKDFIDALKGMCTVYAKWNWKPIPVPQGILFRFPSDGGLELLAKRDVIPCKNGQFFVKRWSETKSKLHHFPIKATILVFNLPPFLRSEEELSKVVAPFAHLIEASQVMEEGGPMKAIVGCRRRYDIPKETSVIYGDQEYTIAIAIRDLHGDDQTKESRAREIEDEEHTGPQQICEKERNRIRKTRR